MTSRTAYFLSVVGLLAALAAGAAAGGVEEAEQHYSAGRALFAAGNIAEARKEFAQAAAADPAHVDARYRLALIDSEDIFSWEKAEAELRGLPALAEKSGAKNVEDVRFRSGLALGKLFVRSGRTADAIAILRKIIAAPPKGAALDEAHAALGVANYYERIYDDAMFELRLAIKLNPANMTARFDLKTIRARLEHFQAGKAYSRIGDHDGAIAEFRRAIDLDPRFIEARHRLGLELHLLGRNDDALKEFRRAESISTSYRKIHEIRFAEGVALKSLGRADEAKKKFLAILVAKPKFADAHNEIGQIQMGSGEYELAILSFITAIGIEPKTDYVRNLQVCMQRQKDQLGGGRGAGPPPSLPGPGSQK